MKSLGSFLLVLVAVLHFSFISAPGAPMQNGSHYLPLNDGWQIQSAAVAGEDGAAISSSAHLVGWYPAAVPSTVLGALVNDGVYTNIFFGTNFAAIPTAPFTNAWWFRREFSIATDQAAGRTDLIFDGINYRANIWLNGKQIAATNETFGAFRIFKFAVGGKLKPGNNTLAVEVFPPRTGDFTMGFVDWNPKPADRGMGLFRPVELHFHQAVALDHLFVESKIDHTNWQSAQLTIHADLSNGSGDTVRTLLNGRINGVSFSRAYELSPGETRSVTLTPQEVPQLNLAHAKLWWPWELGRPNLYHLQLTASVNDQVSDIAQVRFGIREVNDYTNADGYRGYMVNGKKILIRGGGWADELLLRENPQNLHAQIQYTKAMNLNTIRLEGIWGSSQRLYDLADEQGLLVMVGWSCQWEWGDLTGLKDDKFGCVKTEADQDLLTKYLHDQVLWLRNHPSIYVWVLGSDKLPRPELEEKYDSLLAKIDPTRPRLKTCGDDASSVSGPSRVKMNGPYDYVPPDYWYLDTNNGGAFGYNTETGPGPQPPPLETLARMIPADHLWPMDKVWSFHCARGQFGKMNRYWDAFTNRYGPPAGVAEFAFKSQAANYEAIRAMYEAFAVNSPHTTGIVQWMLNPSWPKFFWQLYDYYLVPGGAFFGTKKGAAPVAVIYHYGDRGIYLVNQTRKKLGATRTAVTVYDLNSKIILKQAVTHTAPDYGSEKIFDLSGLNSATPVYFVDLHTVDASGTEIANNFYWLSTKPDVLDEAKTTWYVTPEKSFADFTALNQMPKARVTARVTFETFNSFGTNAGETAAVTLANNSDTLAFFIEMKIVDPQTQQSLTPVFWDDNYISLPPHSTRVMHAHFPETPDPRLKLQGWNVEFEKITGQTINNL